MKWIVSFFAAAIAALFLSVNAHAFEVPYIDGYEEFSENVETIQSGDFRLDIEEIFNNLLDRIQGEVKGFIGNTAVILVLSMLSSTVGTLNDAFGERSAGQASFFVFFTLISGLALSCFADAMIYAKNTISLMCGFMTKLTPVLILMLFTCCKAVSAAAFEPVMSGAVFVISIVIEKCLVPLITFSAVLSVAGNVGDKTGITGFIKIVKSLTKWIMALVITIFTGINAIYGFSSIALDAVGVKTVRFAVGSLVPVVGGFLSDSLDAVVTSAGLLKNAVGISGILIICGICVIPVIKIGVMQLCIRLAAAVAEPIIDKRISSMLWDMSDAVTSVFGMVVLTAVLFLINICIILTATSAG